ncbi:hypothetical protein KAR91_80890 [Candidatus Pacearchaeota archaeon]|nr:hypothetical protein [Candidatus Pacearchaeota archaeon]
MTTRTPKQVIEMAEDSLERANQSIKFARDRGRRPNKMDLRYKEEAEQQIKHTKAYIKAKAALIKVGVFFN